MSSEVDQKCVKDSGLTFDEVIADIRTQWNNESILSPDQFNLALTHGIECMREFVTKYPNVNSDEQINHAFQSYFTKLCAKLNFK